MNIISGTWIPPSGVLGSSPDTPPVRRPAYLDHAPLLPHAPPNLDPAHLEPLFRQLWERRGDADLYVRQEPYTGGLIRVAQALRQEPDATWLSYRLTVGDVADPEVAYQQTRAIQGVTDAARMFELSLTKEEVLSEPDCGLWPQLEVCVATDDGRSVSASQPADAPLRNGEILAVAGRMTNDIGGSLALAALSDEPTLPPPIDLVAEQRLIDFVRAARSLVSAVVPLGRGGLLITLARCCARSVLGAEVRLAEAWLNMAPVALLFGEAQSRCLLTLPGEDWQALQDMARPLEVPLQELGTVDGHELTVTGAINLNLGRVKAWS